MYEGSDVTHNSESSDFLTVYAKRSIDLGIFLLSKRNEPGLFQKF